MFDLFTKFVTECWPKRQNKWQPFSATASDEAVAHEQ